MSKKKTVKATLTRPDGTRLEIEGEPEEVLKAVLALSPPPPAPVIVVQPAPAPYVAPPVVIPSPFWVEPQPFIYTTEIICQGGATNISS